MILMMFLSILINELATFIVAFLFYFRIVRMVIKQDQFYLIKWQSSRLPYRLHKANSKRQVRDYGYKSFYKLLCIEIGNDLLK